MEAGDDESHGGGGHALYDLPQQNAGDRSACLSSSRTKFRDMQQLPQHDRVETSDHEPRGGCAWDVQHLSWRDGQRTAGDTQGWNQSGGLLRQLPPDDRVEAGDDEPHGGDGDALCQLP
jgi:hypothetical protein